MPSASSRRIAACAALITLGGLIVSMPTAALADPATITQTFGYTGATDTFTVPAGITQLIVGLQGGEGGQGGDDSVGPSPAGGYQGVVTGTITVTPGQVLTIAVGQGGATGTSFATGNSDPAHYTDGAAPGGSNPLGYNGGDGGVAGWQGDSGDAGGGGAASVITTNGSTIVAGGAGGAGGSGQFEPTLGRVPYSTFAARSDATSPAGQNGITVGQVCDANTGSCDGGAGGAGGGGVVGGAQGDVQFGSGSSDEWYGYGGYPGQNSTAGFSSLSASYQYYPDDSADGSIVISYTTGAPGAPTSVSGVAGDTSVALSWTPPTAVGESAVSDYVVQYAHASSPTTWTTFADGVSTTPSTTVTGLTDGTAYVFQVLAVNTAGSGAASAPSSSVTPMGVPTSPTITSVTAQDGALSLAFTPPLSGSAPTSYEYQLNGAGAWINAATSTSPLVISGLANGTSYSVRIRANSAVGEGAASPASSGTPAALPGAPSISSTSTGVGTAAVSFTPGYSGGGTITDYEYQLDSGTWTSAGTTVSPLTITGLANATTYVIAIRAVAASGGGAASAGASVTTPGIPAAPVVGTVVAGDTTVSIPYTSGATGGSTITSYQYQLVTSGGWITASSSASPIVVTGLVNATTYQVSLRAINAVGNGTATTPQSVTPATVPGAPAIVGNTVAGSDLHLSAAFTAPISDGGSAITNYDYSTDGGATWRSAVTTTSPIVISALSVDGTTPLVNGRTYFVELRAVNAVGTGIASAVATGIAQTVPSAPSISSVTPGPSSLSVVIVPASNGGAAITSYQYQLGSSGWVDTGTLGTSFIISGLTNGTSYGVTVRALNSQGNGAASSSLAGVPRTTPAQPTITGVTRGDRSLTIAVSDASDGGSAIASWQYSTDGGSTWFAALATSSPLVVTALSTDGTTTIANGTSYPVAVRAVNAAGVSAPSSTTGVGPSTTPIAPVVVLVAQNQAVQVAFTVSDNGGSPISKIEYQLNHAGSWIDAGTLSSPFVIGSLTNGTTYTVNVRADNAIGFGAPSISANATPLTVSDAPTSVSAVSSTASAVVSWTPPVSTGGSAITTYIASAFLTPSSPSPVATCSTPTTSCTITGLTNGVVYYASVVAQNAAGAGAASTPAVAVTPLARPGAPTLNTLSPGDSFLTLGFTAGSAGSSSITGYEYQLNGGAWLPASSTTSPLTITGVANGTSYTVALLAVNDAGEGAASSTLTATPFTFPDAPDPVTTIANGVDGAIIVSWLAPNANGSPITSYTATAFNAPSAGTQVTTCTTAALTCTLSGLSNGTTYYVSIQSQNAAGLSARSARIAVIPSLLPGAVSAVTGVAGNGQVSVIWTPGSTGASPINDYTVWYASGGSYVQFSDGVSTSTSALVTGLTNGTPYTFEIYAVNTGGTGPVSAPSAAITPATVPDAPTIGVATEGNEAATIVWTPPIDNGGSPVTGYVITPSIGAPVTVGSTTSCTMLGLTNGTAYSFQVAAITAAGTGAQSASSNSVTPAPTAPAAPTIGIAAAGNTSATITWTAPIDNGGSAITGYVITPSIGAPVTVGNATTFTMTGLTNGTAYTFQVSAISTVGTGGTSSPSNSVTPHTTAPGAPSGIVASAGNTTATLTWIAPVDDGGFVVTGYVITPSTGAPVTVSAVTTYTVTGLVNGTGYTFMVAAINQLGTGTTSLVASNLVTPSAGGGAAATPSAPVAIFGPDRFGTAIAASAAEFPVAAAAGAVVLARADNYPDALVGIPLAAAKHAPLLFTENGALTAATQAEIVRVLPVGGTVYLLGGTAAIPANVATALNGLGYVVVRYGGNDRFATALAVAAALGNPGTVMLATGTNFPDALAAGPAAEHVNGIVLLTDGSALPPSVHAYLVAHPGTVYAVGGPAVAADPSAIALTGADRYATAVAVAGLFAGPTTVGVASGVTFADALSGGAFLARVDGPLLLSTPTGLPSSTTSYLASVQATVLTSTVFGGPMALAPNVVTAVGSALGATS